MERFLALALCALLWTALLLAPGWGDAPDLDAPLTAEPDWWDGASREHEAPVRPVPRSPKVAPVLMTRTISILIGDVARYTVVAQDGSVTLNLLMRVPRGAYEQLPAFRHCRRGCRLRVYIVQERR